jgi:hypothetical protein
MTVIEWYIDRDEDGEVSRVIRVHHEDGRLWGEFFRDGEWIANDVVLGVLSDPTWGREVTAEEGEAVIAQLLEELP